MAAAKAYNKNNAGVRRIMKEAAELASDPSPDYTAEPLEDDIFEWHCTMRGPPGTEFEGGLYHFRIILPAEYPFRPPSIVMLTPSGRFECGTKICISFTSYHEELWQPAWGVRTAIIGLQGFFPLKGEAAVGLGAIEHPESERRRLAKLSRDWRCTDCGKCNSEILPPASADEKRAVVVEEKKKEEHHQSEEKARQVPEPSPTITHPGRQEPARPPSPPQQTRPHVIPAPHTQHFVAVGHSARPPILLDGAIATLLVLVATLLYRRFT